MKKRVPALVLALAGQKPLVLERGPCLEKRVEAVTESVEKILDAIP